MNVRELRREQLREETSLGTTTLVQQTLPEIEWRGRSRRLGKSPLYLAFESSLSSIQQREKDKPGTCSMSGAPCFLAAHCPQSGEVCLAPARLDADYLRGDLLPTITLPYSPTAWLDVTPEVSYRLTHYTQHQQGSGGAVVDDALTRELWSYGVEIVGPKLFRIFGAAESGGGTRFKHAIEPRIRYGFTDSFDRFEDVLLYDEVDGVSGSGNELSYSLVQRLFAQRPRAEPEPRPQSSDTILPAAERAEGDEAEPDAAGTVPAGPTPPDARPREPVEIASLELRQRRSFDRNLRATDVDGDGVQETSRVSDIEAIGRFNPSPALSLDLRSRYDILFDRVADVTLSGSISGQLAQTRFSLFRRNGLAPGEEDSTQLRLIGGLNLLDGRLKLNVDGSYDADPDPGRPHVPDKRWRVQYSTQCCTFLVERLTRDFSVIEDRRDLYFRVSLQGVGKILDISY
jgi:hypothetical protein